MNNTYVLHIGTHVDYVGVLAVCQAALMKIGQDISDTSNWKISTVEQYGELCYETGYDSGYDSGRDSGES